MRYSDVSKLRFMYALVSGLFTDSPPRPSKRSRRRLQASSGWDVYLAVPFYRAMRELEEVRCTRPET